MANPTLKIVERKTTVPRNRVREAIAAIISNNGKTNSSSVKGSLKESVKPGTDTKKS